MHVVNKKDSIYFQLLRLLVLSAFAAGLFFTVSNHMGVRLVEEYYYNTDYEQKKDLKYVAKLQSYINKNDISYKDFEKLKKWVKDQKVLILRVYMNNKKVFDSDYPDKDFTEEDTEYDELDWETYYSVDFTDGTARIGLIGLYEYQLYNGTLIAEIVISFVLFLSLVLMGIRKKMEYMRILSNEIAILEGGSLDYEITIMGKDELASLAEGLDHMRVSFENMMERETQMMNENQKIITEMSHDLRTPVTSILLYLEILKKNNYKNQEQLKDYCEKIEQKAFRMKQLTEHLFEYSLVSAEKAIDLEEPEYCEVLFYDLLSETENYLMQNGFHTECHLKWESKKIRVYTEYIVRVIDNITSNIIKYADPNCSVNISSVNTESMIGFSFENKVKEDPEKKESTGVGIQSIKNMIKKMNGKCQTVKDGSFFKIEIYFPWQE